jgi:hypothetical protein
MDEVELRIRYIRAVYKLNMAVLPNIVGHGVDSDSNRFWAVGGKLCDAIISVSMKSHR